MLMRDCKQSTISRSIRLDDFRAYMPAHNYIYLPTGEHWPAGSVNSRIAPVPLLDSHGQPISDDMAGAKYLSASAWLDRHRPIEQITWMPGQPLDIQDRLIADGGWIERRGVSCLNTYRAPNASHGNPALAHKWIDHVHQVFGTEAEHIIKWLAHRVQYPGIKINHALVLGGSQGIGKDTLLEPVKYAVGSSNFKEVSPQNVLERFNGFLKSVILRVSEVRDLGDVDRFAFYDHMKAYTAAPPDVLRIDEKHVRPYYVPNVTGVILTTNYKTTGIYLPADDRRHLVAWSNLTQESFSGHYWRDLWGWYHDGGTAHVAAYLAGTDLSSFDPKAPPPKTPAFWDIVDVNRAPEDAELADVLDRLGKPPAITISLISISASNSFGEWINDRRNRRKIPHRLEACGYVPVRNDAAKDGLFVINGARQAVYARAELSLSDRLRVAHALHR
jgi:hypothetical protein